MTDTIPKEQKALISDKDLKPVVSTIPVVEPSDDEILIKAKAFALNPVDFKMPPREENVVLGVDVSGVVVKFGKNVKGFNVGDNVACLIRGNSFPIPRSGAFSEYVLASPLGTYKLDFDLKLSTKDKIPYGEIDTYEAAASLPASLSTAGISLYETLELKKGKDYSNESILIWSGATATGAIAIQIAKWLGFKEIVVTASKIRFDFLRSLGATALYDYNDQDVVSSIRNDFGDNIVYGLDSFSTTETFSATYAALSSTKPVYLCNLGGLREYSLTVPLKTNKVKFGATVSFLALGEDLVFPGFTLEAAGTTAVHSEFAKDIQPYISEKKLKHIPLTVLPNGLEGLIKGLEILQSGKYGAEKLVARA